MGFRRAVRDRERGRQQIWELGDSPAPDHGDDRPDREWAKAADPAGGEQDEGAEPAKRREDHQRQHLGDQAVVGIVTFGVQEDEAGGPDGGRSRRASPPSSTSWPASST